MIPLPASADKKSLNIFFADATAIFDIFKTGNSNSKVFISYLYSKNKQSLSN